MSELLGQLQALPALRSPQARYRRLRALLVAAQAEGALSEPAAGVAQALVVQMAQACAAAVLHEPTVVLLANVIDQLGPAVDAPLWGLLAGPPLAALTQTDATGCTVLVGGKAQALRRLAGRLTTQAAPTLLALARDAREPAAVRDRAAVAAVRLVGPAVAAEVAAMALDGPLEDLFNRADRDAWQRTDLYSRSGPALVPPLLEALAEGRPSQREQARKLLLALDTHARPGLRQAASSHPRAEVRRRAQALLDRLPPAPLQPPQPEDRALSRAEPPAPPAAMGLSEADAP